MRASDLKSRCLRESFCIAAKANRQTAAEHGYGISTQKVNMARQACPRCRGRIGRHATPWKLPTARECRDTMRHSKHGIPPTAAYGHAGVDLGHANASRAIRAGRADHDMRIPLIRGSAVRQFITFTAASFFLFTGFEATGANQPQSIVFGQIRLTGANAVASHWSLVLRNPDMRETKTVALERRTTGSLIYDFTAPLPPGTYHFHMLEAARVDWDTRITGSEQYSELNPGSVCCISATGRSSWAPAPGQRSTASSTPLTKSGFSQNPTRASTRHGSRLGYSASRRYR